LFCMIVFHDYEFLSGIKARDKKMEMEHFIYLELFP